MRRPYLLLHVFSFKFAESKSQKRDHPVILSLTILVTAVYFSTKSEKDKLALMEYCTESNT